MSEELICPFCFTVFKPGALEVEVPFCRECNHYGRGILVEDLKDFLLAVDLNKLQALSSTWFNRKDYLEDERRMILTNIDRLIADLNQK